MNNVRPESRIKYSIHLARTGEVLIESIELDEQEVEDVSSYDAGGHFRANMIEELTRLEDTIVFALTV